MASLLHEIKWSEPLLPATADPSWPAELKRRGATVFEVDRRVAPSPWLREAATATTRYVPVSVPDRLLRIALVVTAQENACRYCYGANRAYMKMMGYPEAFIERIERDVQLAELDPKDRALVSFCRNLARSRPRPSRAALQALVSQGYSQQQAVELAFLIASSCFYNRLSTLMACPPERRFESMANGPLGRVMGIAMRLVQRLKPRPAAAADGATPADGAAGGRFDQLVAALAGLPAARLLRSALNGAFASDVIDRGTKALMFAVVARSLNCGHCESQAVGLLEDEGVDAAEIGSTLATLQSPRLGPGARNLLAWTRETVSYETAAIQASTRALAAGLGAPALLEAIGVASLANGTVRLAMLLE